MRLKKELELAQTVENDKTYFKFDQQKVERIVKKLASGHAKFENSVPQLYEARIVYIAPLESMSDEQRISFLNEDEIALYPEVGSRALIGLIENSLVPVVRWIEVQKNSYAYMVNQSAEGLCVKILIRNYLACKVVF